MPRFEDLGEHQKLFGPTIVELVIGTDGTVRTIRFLKSPGGKIEPIVAAALKQWRFEPATRDGQPIEVSYVLAVHICFQ